MNRDRKGVARDTPSDIPRHSLTVAVLYVP
jgi:hypothetical protein